MIYPDPDPDPDFCGPLAAAICATFDCAPQTRLGVAVSGGGDSVALLHLLHDWAQPRGVVLFAVTVDHGLRPESSAEAVQVAAVCAALGVPHDTLHWTGWDGRGNLPDQARRARLALMAEWAQARGIASVALGHTADDQAETLLMRLARGSGVDGLSGMAVWRRTQGLAWVRPLLGQSRAALRSYLRARAIGWVDDPTNDDLRYDRIKARKALAVLADLGVGADGLAQTAQRLAGARAALERCTDDLAQHCVQIAQGDVILAQAGLAAAPLDLQYRLVARAIGWVSSAEYRPRMAAMQAVVAGLHRGEKAALGGCLLVPKSGAIRIFREFQAVRACRAVPGALWDGRWILRGPALPDLHIAALGAAGLAQCIDWRAVGAPRASLLASPAVWQQNRLISAPLAGWHQGWQADLIGLETLFPSLSH